MKYQWLMIELLQTKTDLKAEHPNPLGGISLTRMMGILLVRNRVLYPAFSILPPLI